MTDESYGSVLCLPTCCPGHRRCVMVSRIQPTTATAEPSSRTARPRKVARGVNKAGSGLEPHSCASWHGRRKGPKEGVVAAPIPTATPPSGWPNDLVGVISWRSGCWSPRPGGGGAVRQQRDRQPRARGSVGLAERQHLSALDTLGKPPSWPGGGSHAPPVGNVARIGVERR